MLMKIKKISIFLLVMFAFFSKEIFADWAIHNETNTPTVFSHQGSGYSHANIFKPSNGPLQVYIWVRPINAEYCRAQGEANGDLGYVVQSKAFVNNTVVYMKKFIEPTSKGCYIYFAGKSLEDKKVLVSEFMKSSDVFVEIDGADKGFATKYRGKQILITGAVGLDGSPFSFQFVNDAFGTEHRFVTVPTSQVRWYRFKTKNFKKFWNQSNTTK